MEYPQLQYKYVHNDVLSFVYSKASFIISSQTPLIIQSDWCISLAMLQ